MTFIFINNFTVTNSLHNYTVFSWRTPIIQSELVTLCCGHWIKIFKKTFYLVKFTAIIKTK